MAVGKRTSTLQPLTEHDVAERLDAAALRVWRILSDARQLGIMGAVRSSRYWHGAVNHMLGELEAWNVEPWHLPDEPGDAVAVTRPANGIERERAEAIAALHPRSNDREVAADRIAQALVEARTAGRLEAIEVIEALVPASARTPRLVDALDRARADA